VKILTSVVPDGVWVLPPEQVERLRRQFPDLTIVDAPARDERLRELADTDVAFLSRLKPDEFAEAPRLKWIQSPAAGVGGLLFPELRVSSVIVTNARGLHGEPVAEHVVAVTIVLFRQIHQAIRRQAAHVWRQESLDAFQTLVGSTMGVVGLGAIGGAVADKAAALGMRVVAVRRRAAAARPLAVSAVYPPDQLPRLLEEADVVVLAAPLTAETGGLIGAAELRRMKPNAILINVARGRLVREDELAAELARGTIAGAALDVFEHEPLAPDSPLWELPNVIVTPHTSAFRSDYWKAAVDMFADNLARYLRGAPLRNVVDKGAGY
jgi:phosphoglycerate dehydrogenase-like enzyme